jgi:hypothetical protein
MSQLSMVSRHLKKSLRITFHKLHGSASYVKDDLPFLWEHAFFDPS